MLFACKSRLQPKIKVQDLFLGSFFYFFYLNWDESPEKTVVYFSHYPICSLYSGKSFIRSNVR